MTGIRRTALVRHRTQASATGRPFHAIMPVGSEERMSVALRMNTGPETEDRRTTALVHE